MEKEGNRNYKSSVFSLLLKEKKYALEVFNALNGTAYGETEDFRTEILENAVYLSYRNDASFLLAMMLNVYEHQSTFNPNMPLRDLIYVSNLLADIVKEENLFGGKQVKIPAPRFVTFYNGTEERPEWEVLKLSDAFLVSVKQPELELRCTVININEGCNKAFMEKCPVIREYSVFVGKVRRYGRVMNLNEAVDKAIDECIEEHVLEEFLKMQKAQVKSLSVLDFDLEKQLRFAKKDGWEEGREEGRKEGKEEGRREGKEEGRREGKEEGRREGKEEGRREGKEEGRAQGSDLFRIAMVCRKLKKGKTPEMIAEDLEEDKDLIRKICEAAKEFAPEYDEEKIYEKIEKPIAV